MEHKGKLELTWVGKYDDRVIEPRILMEDREKSYGDPRSENMLIHGDNLIALQALQQDFSGKIKCIYIDPPFNTGYLILTIGKKRARKLLTEGWLPILALIAFICLVLHILEMCR